MPGETEATKAPGSETRTAWALIAIAIVPFAMRAALIGERVSRTGLVDLRGFLSDLAISACAAILLLLVSRFSRVLATALLVPWGLLHYANFETVSVLGALASVHDLAYVGDSTFFFGSAVAISRPLLLVGAPALSIGLFWWAAATASLRPMLACLGLAAVAFGGHWIWPFAGEAARWRQVDFVQTNVSTIVTDLFWPYQNTLRFRDSQTAVLDLMPSMAADLEGEPIVPLSRRKSNVLLVILESVSGVHVRSLAADHDWNPDASMPNLDAIARSNIAYSTFIAHQRRTNRGLYSLLCGDLPNLLPGLPKMSGYVEGGRICLPEVLRRHGYETVYLQSAPLAFMLKDRFMPLAGFHQVYGHKWFDRHYAQSRWGVDDKAMLEQSIELIEELQKGDKPWFLAMLTVGTHHPYLFPEGFQEGHGTEEQRSLAYLDAAIGAFNRRLNELGVTQDTLVVYTSDESSGTNLDEITQSWGHLIARVPGGKQLRVREPFAQMDVALSILDFVGLGNFGSHLFGRSIFRRYERDRHLFFSNTNMFYAGARDSEGRLLLCNQDHSACSKFEIPDGKLFSRKRRQIDAPIADFLLMKRMAHRSIAGRSDEAAARVFDMMVDPVFVVDASANVTNQMMHGGVYVDLDPGEWVEVEIEAEAVGPPGAHTMFHHLFRSLREEEIRSWFRPLKPGETLRLRYTYRLEEAVDGLQCRSIAIVEGDQDVELHFKVARMTHHRSGEAPEPGLQIVTAETLRTDGGAAPAS